MLGGALFVIVCDLLARTVHPPTEIRLGIITAACGAPFFLYLLRRQRGGDGLAMSLRLEKASLRIGVRHLVRDVTVEAGPARITALIGPNGAGKSTALRLMAGLWTPTGGRASLDGTDLPRLSRRLLARRISFVPQDTHVDVPFTVRELVTMGRHPPPAPVRRSRPDRRGGRRRRHDARGRRAPSPTAPSPSCRAASAGARGHRAQPSPPART